jgi:hypothetical protein
MQDLPSSHHKKCMFMQSLAASARHPKQQRLFCEKKNSHTSKTTVVVSVVSHKEISSPCVKSFLQDIRNSNHRGSAIGLGIHLLSSKIMPLDHSLFVIIYFLRKEQPSVSLALPPVGWQRTVEQPAQTTTVSACEKTVVIVKQPGHLTSIKNDRGAGTRVCRGC